MISFHGVFKTLQTQTIYQHVFYLRFFHADVFEFSAHNWQKFLKIYIPYMSLPWNL